MSAPLDEKPPDAAAPPEIARARTLFDQGNYRDATAALRALLAGQPSPAAAEVARNLLARMAPDPWAVRFGLGALGLLALLFVIYVL